MLKSFKKFIMRGNILDMSVGIIVGSAFTKIINSLVQDILMPPIGLLLSGIDFSNIFIVIKKGAADAGPYYSLESAKAAGAVVIGIGAFVNTIISFLITALSIYVIITAFNKMHEAFSVREKAEKAASEKKCPYCCSSVSAGAVRCPYCTSDLPEETPLPDAL